MTEPDFEHMARKFTESLQSVGVSDDDFDAVYEAYIKQLRQVWNARGAADVDEVFEIDEREAIRKLDR